MSQIPLLRKPRFCFPIFGSGPLFNIFTFEDMALTNMMAHIGWSLAIPLMADKTFGRRGMLLGGLGWIIWTLVYEMFMHAPPEPGPGYASEVRTDLVSRLVPCIVLMALCLR